MKKLLFVIDSLGCGGAERSLVSLLPLLDYTRYEVDLMMLKRGGVFERYVPAEVNILPPPQRRRLIGAICRLVYSLALRLRRLMGARRHTAELHWMTSHPAYITMKKEYDAAIAYQQGFPTYYVASKVKARLKYAWINVDMLSAGYTERFNRRFYDQMRGCVAVSAGLCHLLWQSRLVSVCKLCTIYDIVNHALIRRMSEEEGFTDTLPTGTLRLLTAGRMTKQKNYQLAVQAAAELKRRGMKFRWYFIGDGTERKAVEHSIAHHGLENEVRLLGMLPNPYPFMRQCDIYVQTSLFEGYCLTLCEARLLGKPEVTTCFTVANNQIRDGENGLIAQMTPESIADKITLLATDHNLLRRIAQEAKQERNLTAETELRKIISLMEE